MLRILRHVTRFEVTRKLEAFDLSLLLDMRHVIIKSHPIQSPLTVPAPLPLWLPVTMLGVASRPGEKSGGRLAPTFRQKITSQPCFARGES